jgi:CRISPR system Cascade subunit CasD
VRDSAPEPTKSGVIGLLACALGRGDDETIRALSAALRMGVRVDEAGVRLTDYHTVGGGYETPALLTAEGKPKWSSGGPHTEISPRDYLADASFLVALRGDPALIAQLTAALQDPVWVVYLGRKSCPPARPVFAGVDDSDDLESALAQQPWPPRRAERPGSKRQERPAIIECEPEPDAVRRRDHMVSRRYRLYEPRYIRTIRLSPPEVAS